ncbi:MAG: hypothetical protein QW806_09180 [Nitrososphaerota archaeon]
MKHLKFNCGCNIFLENYKQNIYKVNYEKSKFCDLSHKILIDEIIPLYYFTKIGNYDVDLYSKQVERYLEIVKTLIDKIYEENNDKSLESFAMDIILEIENNYSEELMKKTLGELDVLFKFVPFKYKMKKWIEVYEKTNDRIYERLSLLATMFLPEVQTNFDLKDNDLSAIEYNRFFQIRDRVLKEKYVKKEAISNE